MFFFYPGPPFYVSDDEIKRLFGKLWMYAIIFLNKVNSYSERLSNYYYHLDNNRSETILLKTILS